MRAAVYRPRGILELDADFGGPIRDNPGDGDRSVAPASGPPLKGDEDSPLPCRGAILKEKPMEGVHDRRMTNQMRRQTTDETRLRIVGVDHIVVAATYDSHQFQRR